MPISTDTTKFSIDFAYEWESPDGQTLAYSMKFLHSQFGPTVQISDGNDGMIEFPADMFVEVANFLIQNGVIKGGPMPMAQKMNKPSPMGMPMVKPRVTGAIPMGGGGVVRNPLVPEVTAFQNQNIQDQPPPVDVDPEQIMRERIEAKAKASANRRGKVKGQHKAAEDGETE
jgi:hypothetical protein